MICERCHATGMVRELADAIEVWVPCGDCGGCGRTACPSPARGLLSTRIAASASARSPEVRPPSLTRCSRHPALPCGNADRSVVAEMQSIDAVGEILAFLRHLQEFVAQHGNRHRLGLFPKDPRLCTVLFSATRERRVVVRERSHDLANGPHRSWCPLLLFVAGRAAQTAPRLRASNFTCPEFQLILLRTGSCEISKQQAAL